MKVDNPGTYVYMYMFCNVFGGFLHDMAEFGPGISLWIYEPELEETCSIYKSGVIIE